MKKRAESSTPFFITVIILIAVCAAVCIFAFSCAGSELNFKAVYYYVSYKSAGSATSASSVSDAVTSFGGAGYIVEYDGEYFVTVACYYTEHDAETVKTALAARDLDCEVLKAERKSYKLANISAKKNAGMFADNLSVLNDLSRLAYECANGLDKGEFNQSKAKSAVAAIDDGLESLKRKNSGNCFFDGLCRLGAQCDDAGGGFIYSKDMRALQIAICDFIINVQLY